MPQLVRLCESVRQQRGFGDFYGYHLVARGQADLMIEAQTKPWDIAAMRVIIEEAGGRFTDISGGTKFKGNVLSAVASNGHVHDEVLAYPRTREPRIYPWVNGFLSRRLSVRGVRPSTVSSGATGLPVGLHFQRR